MKKTIITSAIFALAMIALSGCRTSVTDPFAEEEEYDVNAAYEEMYQEDMDDYYYEYMGY